MAKVKYGIGSRIVRPNTSSTVGKVSEDEVINTAPVATKKPDHDHPQPAVTPEVPKPAVINTSTPKTTVSAPKTDAITAEIPMPPKEAASAPSSKAADEPAQPLTVKLESSKEEAVLTEELLKMKILEEKKSRDRRVQDLSKLQLKINKSMAKKMEIENAIVV